jgi:Uncharacterized conserved protein (COG2071)
MNLLNRIMHVHMMLHNVFYVSYLIPVSRVRPLVPRELNLATIEQNKVFVSVVALQCEGAGARLLPFPRLNYNQINVRTYVRDPQTGKHAVYFLKSGVTSALVSLLTRTMGIPWQHIDFDLQVATDEPTHYTTCEVSGYWDGEFSLKARGTQVPPGHIPPFEETKSAIDYLVRPLIGCFGREGQVKRFTIGHPEVTPFEGWLDRFHFPILNSLNLIDEKEILKPQSVLFVPQARFDIYLPPAKVKMTDA